jgi:uncharacterized protein (TIGR02246 family)
MLGDAETVRAVNQRFYDALSRQNMLAMEEIWAHRADVRCVHPGRGIVEGWDAVRASWRAIFTHAICLTVVPEEPRVTVLGPTAIVTCRENISSFTLEGSRVVAAQATNVFEKRDGRWHLVHHHASSIEAADTRGTD